MSLSPFKPKPLEILNFLPSLGNMKIKTGNAAIKNAAHKQDDMVFFSFSPAMHFSGVYTQSETAASPVCWCRKIEKNTKEVKGLLVNSGNANSCNGKHGLDAIQKLLTAVAKAENCEKEELLICSTGVIGERLPVEKMIATINKMQENDFVAAAKTIMTTDTFPKYIDRKININGKNFRITAIEKGAGMIAPDMATLLVFIFTDFPLGVNLQKNILQKTVANSFNLITVDSDTSTNDTVLLFSPVCKTRDKLTYNDESAQIFSRELDKISKKLAEMIIKDAEGIKKFIKIQIKNAKDKIQAKKIAFSIANSPLCKTAIAGEDPNWGRILMAIGKAKAAIDIEKLKLAIGEHKIFANGSKISGYDEGKLQKYMQQNEILIHVDVGLGKSNIEVLTSDLNAAYIAINADYRS